MNDNLFDRLLSFLGIVLLAAIGIYSFVIFFDYLSATKYASVMHFAVWCVLESFLLTISFYLAVRLAKRLL